MCLQTVPLKLVITMCGHTWQKHPANYSFYLQPLRRVPPKFPAEQQEERDK